MRKINTAVIGIGKWGQNLLGEFDRQSNVLHACHRGSPESLKILESYPHIKATKLEDVFGDKSVQAVVIATPTDTHHEIMMAALKAGKHIFVEKPGTDSFGKLEVVCIEADRRNLVLAVGYVFVHHPAAAKLREIFSGGDIQNLIFRWDKTGSFNDHPLPNLASHDLAVAKSFGLDIDLGSLLHSGLKVISDDPDIIDISFEFEGGSGNIHVNRVSDRKDKTLTIMGDAGSFLWHNDKLMEILSGKKNGEIFREVGLPKTTALGEEVRDFLLSISQNREPIVNGRFALDIWRIIERLMEK